jgi:hypothetical protein
MDRPPSGWQHGTKGYTDPQANRAENQWIAASEILYCAVI